MVKICLDFIKVVIDLLFFIIVAKIIQNLYDFHFVNFYFVVIFKEILAIKCQSGCYFH